MYNFDPYNVLLSIATNIPVLLMTAFVLQGHIYILSLVLMSSEDNLPHNVSFTMLFAMRHRIALKSNFTPPPSGHNFMEQDLVADLDTLSCGSANDVSCTLS